MLIGVIAVVALLTVQMDHNVPMLLAQVIRSDGMSFRVYKNTEILWCDIDRCREKWVGQPGDDLPTTVLAATRAGWIIVLRGHRCPRHRHVS